MKAFGVDVGGTTIKIGLVSDNGELLDKWVIPTNVSENGLHIIDDVANVIREKTKELKLDPNEIAGIGMGVPGPVDDSGIVHKAVNLHWGRFNLTKKITEITGLKAAAANDANCAAMGEYWVGAGKGADTMLLVTLGTGIGSGIISKGRIVTGAKGGAGEIGHMIVKYDETRQCNCGHFGCLEQYASATGIVYLTQKILLAYTMPSVLRDVKHLSAKIVFDAMEDGDELSAKIVFAFGKYLGRALASAASILNPDLIVIGGGVSHAGEILIDFVKPEYQKYVFHISKNTDIRIATIGNDAGMLGAAKLIFDRAKE